MSISNHFNKLHFIYTKAICIIVGIQDAYFYFEYSNDFSNQYYYPAYLKYVASNHSLSDQKVLEFK